MSKFYSVKRMFINRNDQLVVLMQPIGSFFDIYAYGDNCPGIRNLPDNYRCVVGVSKAQVEVWNGGDYVDDRPVVQHKKLTWRLDDIARAFRECEKHDATDRFAVVDGPEVYEYPDEGSHTSILDGFNRPVGWW